MNRLLFAPLFLIFLQTASAQTVAPPLPDSLEWTRAAEVYFDFGRWELHPEADSLLTALADSLTGLTGLRLHITAHTDAIGSNQSNEELARKRANSVRDTLLARGLPDSILTIVAYGERRPVAENDTDAGRQLNRRATIDIYRVVPRTRVRIRVVEAESGTPVSAELVVHSKAFRDSLSTDEEGKAAYVVTAPLVMGVDAFAPGYFFTTKMLKVPNRPEYDAVVELKKAAPGARVDLSNLYFVGNQAVLLPRSEPELPKILRFVRLNADLRIEIAGHVNHPNSPPLTEDSWEYDLSVRRARLVYDYLIANGIDPARLEYHGYGNWEMRYPHARTDLEQELNRRVEIRILE